MIISFKCSETEKIWRGDVSRRLPENIQITARKKLRMLNNAHTIKDLMIPPANKLESLKGDLIGRYSIRINDQWRLCFSWQDNNACDIEIVDYH